MIFYKTSTNSTSYADILLAVSQRDWVDINYLAKDYVDFIINVITAIANDVDITLVDYRNTIKEVTPNIISVVPQKYDTTDLLIDAITQSKSNIGIYSSGTTAEPKLIYQSISRLMKSVRVSGEYHCTRWGFTYNPSHSAGIQVFLQVIANQASLYDLYKCSRIEILETLQNEKITHLSATPTFYRMLAPYDFNIPTLKSITFNGEKSTKELINDIAKVCSNARIRNIYGSTESGPLMSSESTVFKVPDRLIDNIKIVDSELLIRGNLISKSVGSEEWYPTGDLVKIVDADPMTIEFVTRKTRILNVGGQNVNPQEVEEHLIRHSAVKDAKVYGRKNKMIGNLVVADVQLLQEEKISEKELIDWCKKYLANYKVPRMIKLVEKIDIGRTGKKKLG